MHNVGSVTSPGSLPTLQSVEDTLTFDGVMLQASKLAVQCLAPDEDRLLQQTRPFSWTNPGILFQDGQECQLEDYALYETAGARPRTDNQSINDWEWPLTPLKGVV